MRSAAFMFRSELRRRFRARNLRCALIHNDLACAVLDRMKTSMNKIDAGTIVG